MTLTVQTSADSYDFEGPYTSIDRLRSQSGVYVITTKVPDGTHNIIDVGESANIRNRVSNHDRLSEWSRFNKSDIYASVYYCDEANRMAIERAVRERFAPPCGDR